MKRLWAPWRFKYVTGPKEKECIFCTKPTQDTDRDNLILYRGKRNYVIMNLYPYNNGHLMVVPYRHTDVYTALDEEEVAEMGVLMQKSTAILAAFGPHGFNMGMNIGAVGGAGIDEHIHMHLVPRWNGDTNFMPVVGETRVMVQDIHDSYDSLIDAFRAL